MPETGTRCIRLVDEGPTLKATVEGEMFEAEVLESREGVMAGLRLCLDSLGMASTWSEGHPSYDNSNQYVPPENEQPIPIKPSYATQA